VIHYIEETTSTNDDAGDMKYGHGDAICAERQTNGRGQRGNRWIGGEGDNLTFSMVLEPLFLPVVEQFRLSEIVALALIDSLLRYGVEARIKWTNDIYVGDRKLAGVLIENKISGTTLSRTIVGVGVNVNQAQFDKSLPNPISIFQIIGYRIDKREFLERFNSYLLARYERLKSGDKSAQESEYISKMYRRGEIHPYRLASGEVVDGSIVGVRHSGELIVNHSDGTLGEYLFKEIEFIIATRDV